MSTGEEKGTGRYSPEQVQAILERAISNRKGGDDLTGISYEELQETAVELDIDAGDLDAAIMEYEASWELEDARERWLVRRKEKFFEHLRSYLIVNAMLMGIALLSGSGFWFLWPLLGWGVGLAFDASEAFYPKQSDIDRGADRLLRKEERSRRKREKGKRKISIDLDGLTNARNHGAQSFSRNIIIDPKRKKLIIEKGDRRIEIG